MNKVMLSVIVPANNNEQDIKKSVNYLLNQEYKDIEVILIGDNSKRFSSTISDNRLKYINYKGCWATKILKGIEQINGEYFTFLMPGEYATVGYYSSIINNAIDGNYDIVISNRIFEDNSGHRYSKNVCKSNNMLITSDSIFEEYFKSEGLISDWYAISNKIYSKYLASKLIKQISSYSLHNFNEFVFSSLLFYYAKAISQIDNDFLICNNFSSDLTGDNFDYIESDISSLSTSVKFVEMFLKTKKIYNKFQHNLLNWKRIYTMKLRERVASSESLESERKDILNEQIDQICDAYFFDNMDFFQSHIIEWDNRFEDLKTAIIAPNIKVISFDIFDTLVTRPFLSPIDLFKFLDTDYHKLRGNNKGISFSKIRPIAENIARKEQYEKDPSIEDVTLDDIYYVIKKLYEIDEEILNILKEKEKQYEIYFCNKRKSAYELYKLALDMGKYVICTSDMYLPEDTILNILNKNGYNKIYKLYLSSTIKKMKSSGSLYNHVINDLGINSNEIIHIGDNFYSDYTKARELGINAFHFVKTTDLMTDSKYTNCLSKMLTSSLPFWQDNKAALDFFGIRSMLAVVANKYFDNPYKTFDIETDFNSDPELIGYYALGMYQFGITKWLISNFQNKNYDKISFLARDGYLAMESYKLMKGLYKGLPDEEYIYLSRKALMPVMIADKSDFYKLSELISFSTQTPAQVIKYVGNILDINEKKLMSICEEKDIKFNNNFSSIEEFNKFIKILIDNFYNEQNHKKNREKLRNYFDQILGKNPAVFDVGYSGRPEFYLSDLLNKKIDTYFLNINKDEALEYSRLGNFEIHTFFPAKPTATGNAYEHIISKLAPSCISYELSKDEVIPIFEKYNNNYQVEYVIKIMQDAALSFIKDIISIFGKELDILYYQDYYISLPIMAYFNSSTEKDKLPLSPVLFEDEIRTGDTTRMVDNMYSDLAGKNQQLLTNLFSCPFILDKPSKSELNYNPIVDLTNKGRFSRLIFYLVFDRTTFNRRLNDSLSLIKRKFIKTKKND